MPHHVLGVPLQWLRFSVCVLGICMPHLHIQEFIVSIAEGLAVLYKQVLCCNCAVISAGSCTTHFYIEVWVRRNANAVLRISARGCSVHEAASNT